MHNSISDPETAAEHDPCKQRELIGDRGDYFLNRIQGETGVNAVSYTHLTLPTN